MIKGVVDAIDGELAESEKGLLYVGRYWDTIADTIGLILVTYAFGQYLNWDNLYSIGIVIVILLQYSLFNHFSVKMRQIGAGDDTSHLDEKICPVAKPGKRYPCRFLT